MKNWTRMLISALAATMLVTIAFACDHDKATAQNGEKAAGCTHAAAVKAEGGGCPHAKAEAASMNGKESGGCMHGAKAEHASYKDTTGGCPFHSEATESQRAALLKGEKVTLVGHVVCASCDLKQAKECKSVFKTDAGDLYAIVGNDAFEKLAGETRHGEKKVEVSGTTAKQADESIILLESFKLVG